MQGDAIDLGPPLVAIPSDSLDSSTSNSSDDDSGDDTPAGDTTAVTSDTQGTGVSPGDTGDGPGASTRRGIAIGEPELTVVVADGKWWGLGNNRGGRVVIRV